MIQRHLASALCALALMPQGSQAAHENFVIRRFPIQPSIVDVITDREEDVKVIELGSERTLRTIDEKTLMKFFQQCGQSFPEGSYIRYNPLDSTLIHYNTEENQKRLGGMLGGPSIPVQVRIDALLVDFPIQEIDKIARGNSRPLPRSEDILQLWLEGKGTLLHALKLITRSGVNTQVKAVAEHIYAKMFEGPCPSTNTSHLSVTQLPRPCVFETREAGAVLNITPTVGPDSRTIDLTLFHELSIDPEWTQIQVTRAGERGNQTALKVPQPLFHSRNITTSLVVDDQSTHVLGGMTNPKVDGITYLLLTTTLIDPLGRPLADYAGESTEDAQPAR